MELVSTPKLEAFLQANTARPHTAVAGPVPNRINEIVLEIAKSEQERDDLVKNVRQLRGNAGVVLSANQVLKRLVIAKNADALDVMGVFGDLRVPRELTDLSSEDVSQSIRTRVSDSVYRNMSRDFVAFVVRNGYALSGTVDGISTQDLVTLIKGLRAARYMKKELGVKSLAAAYREANAGDARIEEISKEIALLNEEQTKLALTTQGLRTQKVPMSAEISKKQEDLRSEKQKAKTLETEIADLSKRVDVLKTTRGMSQDNLKAKVIELKQEFTGLQYKYQELANERKSSGTSKATRDKKVFDLQEQSLQRKLTEKKLQLQNKYSKLASAEQTKAIKKELAAWERVQRDHLAEVNRLNNRDPNTKPGMAAEKIDAQMNEILQTMQDLEGRIRILQQASMLSTEERASRIGNITNMMSLKRQELKNQARKVTRREALVQNELDPDIWMSRIEEKLEDKKFVDQLLKHHPLKSMLTALEFGVDQKTRQMLNIAWSYFKRGRNTKQTRTLRVKPKTAMLHFGSNGFVVDPRFKKINAELVTVLSTALNEAYKKAADQDLSADLLPAVLDCLGNTPEQMHAHKASYNKLVASVYKQLTAPKTKVLLEEIVEDLVVRGKITTPSGVKPNKKFVDGLIADFVGVIKQSRCIEKLAGFTWPGYREDMSAWIRNTFKIEKKVRKPVTMFNDLKARF